MQCLFAFVFILLLLHSGVSEASDRKSGAENQSQIVRTIWVDQSSKGQFRSVQEAIDSVPSNNNQWIRIHIAPGTYREKVTIPIDKPYIFLDGTQSRHTTIEWNDHSTTSQSATFTSYPDNIVARGISFKNFYNIQQSVVGNDRVVQAVAARIYGDKSAFYYCGFFGLQDTLWDVQGRHYFYGCYIEGGIDFIFGNGQSIYERCHIDLTIGKYEHTVGYITAQGRNSPNDPSGFVFKYCEFTGSGKAYLGRAYGAYSRVIIYRYNLMYLEHRCHGAGADLSRRVPWMARLRTAKLNQLVDLSYIDEEGWIGQLPIQH